MDTEQLTDRVDRVGERWGPTVLRWTAALLWLANVNWKVPPDFGRSGDRCVALCRYVEAGVEFPVAPGSAWFFDNVASPNLALFGWVTLVVESVLVVLLVSGRFVRSAAVLGMAMSAGIGVAVANAEHEWYWSYVLMIALHLAILVTARDRSAAVGPGDGRRHRRLRRRGGGRPCGRRVHGLRRLAAVQPGQRPAGRVGPETPSPDPSRSVWASSSSVSPAGSRPIGSIRGIRRIVGWVLVGVGAALLVTYEQGGLVIGLGSRPGNACVLAAFGLATGRAGRSAVRSPFRLVRPSEHRLAAAR